MDNNTKIQLLKEEYILLQNIIEKFDNKSIIIKSWSITFSLTTLASFFITKNYFLLLLTLVSALLFWIIETLWKTFQYSYYYRIGKIEKFFKNENYNIIPLQIGSDWYYKYKKISIKNFIKIMFWTHVLLPHFFIIFLCIIIYFYSFII